MTTATLATHGRTMDTETARPRRSLEELVDRLFEAMGFKDETGAADPSTTRTIHEARRLRQAGDVDGALAVLAGMDVGKATPSTRSGGPSPSGRVLVKRRFCDRDPAVYSQGAGRAAALVPTRQRDA